MPDRFEPLKITPPLFEVLLLMKEQLIIVDLPLNLQNAPPPSLVEMAFAVFESKIQFISVSYTHLTLPTICSV